jgi:hypothetical protein
VLKVKRIGWGQTEKVSAPEQRHQKVLEKERVERNY